MPYELYHRTAVRVDAPTIAIVPDGRIAVNAAATRCFMRASVKAVVLLWDRSNKKIALKAAPKANTNAYALSVAPDHHSGMLRAKTFLAHIGWNAVTRTTLPAEWNEEEKMLEVTLPEQHLGSVKTTIKHRKP